MSRSDAPVSLADLAAAGVRLRPLEVVTVVRELVLQVARGEGAGMPSAHVIRLSPSGAIFVEGPVAAGGRSVARAAQLLDTLLPGFDAPPELRAPGALRLVVARALGTVDLPTFPTLEAFAAALERFAAPDGAAVVRQLVASWAESVAAEEPGLTEEQVERENREDDEPTERVLESFAPAVSIPVAVNDLTVSDVRRARRATGLTLTQVGERSRIPVSLLRELEWGYLRNWPSGHYGRTQLVRYARAAGLDEEVVIRAIWPLIEEAARPDAVVVPAVVDDPQSAPAATNVPVLVTGVSVLAQQSQARRSRILAALAIPALLFLAVAPAILNLAARRAAKAVAPAASSAAAAPAAATVAADAPAPQPVAVPDRVEDPAAAAAPETEPSASVPGARQVAVMHAAPAGNLAPDAAAYSPTFSSVGSAMFYHAEADGRSALMRADTDSRGAVLRVTRIVDDSSRNFHARPSPDGSRIAFDSDREGERGVYVADANGEHVRRVSGAGFAAVPSWSPDGDMLAFIKAEPGRPRVWNVWTVELATQKLRRVTNYQVGQPWGGSWFPDGKRIAYSHEARLVIRDLETGAERVYPSPRKGRLVRTPSVSPDGRRIIFQVHREGTWLLELKDGSMRKVLSDPTAEEYTWAPDGTRVAYHSNRSGSWNVWVMAPR